MELAEIITAAAEKRVREAISEVVDPEHDYTPINTAVQEFASKIAKEEIAKRETEIRKAIIEKLDRMTISLSEHQCIYLRTPRADE